MLGLLLADSHKIVTDQLRNYVERQLDSGSVNKTAEAIGHYLAGLKVSRYYRADMTEPENTLISRQFLRGVLADYTRV